MIPCFVYKSLRKSDTYLYLRERDAFGLLPASVAEPLGQLHFVIELQLSPERQLAREDVGVVIRNLAASGFHVQFPPPLLATI
ncbi:MAG: YcgL domain-containing protein [Tahibacter sp.]